MSLLKSLLLKFRRPRFEELTPFQRVIYLSVRKA